MALRVGDSIALSALVLLVACGADDERGPSTFVPGEMVSSPASPRKVDEPPSGACADEGAQEEVQTPAGLDACRKLDASFVAATPNVWQCTCAGGQWSCKIIQGAFGVMGCP